jgi:hypothetical protein
MVATRKHRTVIYLDPAEREALRKLSAKTGAPVAELVRRAVNYWLKRQHGRGAK